MNGGRCETCEWFRYEGEVRGPLAAAAFKVGTCWLNPPMPIPVQVQGEKTPANPEGFAVSAQPLRPPVRASDRCAYWRNRGAANG